MAVTQTSQLLATTVLDSEHLLGVAPLDESEIDDSKSDAFSPWLPPFSEIDPLSQLHIGGDEDLQNKIRLLCHKFREFFSNELPDSPALIPPFDIVVDDTKWKVSKNRTSPRSQSSTNQAEILRQISKYSEQGIIEKPHSANYSQVLLVPKPGGSKRMCIDYRSLNDCTVDASGPIPNI